jgi:hypothetical protein
MSRLNLGRVADMSVADLVNLGLSRREVAYLAAQVAAVGRRRKRKRGRKRRGERGRKRERSRRDQGEPRERYEHENARERLNRPSLVEPPAQYAPAFEAAGFRPASWIEGMLGEALPPTPVSTRWSKPIILGTTPDAPAGSGNIKMASRGGVTVVSRTIAPGLHLVAEVPTQHAERVTERLQGARFLSGTFSGERVGYVNLVANLIPALTKAVDSVVRSVPALVSKVDEEVQTSKARRRVRAAQNHAAERALLEELDIDEEDWIEANPGMRRRKRREERRARRDTTTNKATTEGGW